MEIILTDCTILSKYGEVGEEGNSESYWPSPLGNGKDGLCGALTRELQDKIKSKIKNEKMNFVIIATRFF